MNIAEEGATNYVYYDVIIGDKNDNAPEPVGEGWDVSMCHQYDEDQMISSITTLHVQDIDGPSNQGPFTFELYPDDKYFRLEYGKYLRLEYCNNINIYESY